MKRLLAAIGLSSLMLATSARADGASQGGVPSAGPADVLFGRISAGVGGGSGGLAARVGGELSAWLDPHVGVGVLALATTQSKILGADLDYWGVAPALTLRNWGAKSTLFGGLAAGYARGSTTPARGLLCGDGCSDPPAQFWSGVLVSISGGVTSPAGPFEVGGALALDIIAADRLSEGTVRAFTANLILGLGR